MRLFGKRRTKQEQKQEKEKQVTAFPKERKSFDEVVDYVDDKVEDTLVSLGVDEVYIHYTSDTGIELKHLHEDDSEELFKEYELRDIYQKYLTGEKVKDTLYALLNQMVIDIFHDVDFWNEEEECEDEEDYDDNEEIEIEDYEEITDEAIDQILAEEEGEKEEEEDMSQKSKEFQVGDKVRVVRKNESWNELGGMDKWLGKIMTIRKIYPNSGYVCMVEDMDENIGTFLGGGWAWRKECLEPVAKRFTIEISDGISTLSDGTNTVQINRYHKDEHNERTAIKELFAKYYTIEVGDTVKIVKSGKTYPTYDDWLVENEVPLKTAIKWQSGKFPTKKANKETFKVVAIHPHEDHPLRNLVLIESETYAFLIGMDGIKKSE